MEGEYSLRFQYGIPNSLYPGKILRKEFVLDIDGYTNDALNQKEVMDKIKVLNERITSLFEKCIGNKLRNIMETEE